jgi:hypothetical protein
VGIARKYLVQNIFTILAGENYGFPFSDLHMPVAQQTHPSAAAGYIKIIRLL